MSIIQESRLKKTAFFIFRENECVFHKISNHRTYSIYVLRSYVGHYCLGLPRVLT